MISRQINKILGIFITLFVFLLVLSSKTYAYTTSCSESLPPSERLECLNEEYIQLNNEKDSLESAIASEQQSQSSLTQQIEYLSYLIRKSEITILELEVDIERNNIEIIILGEEINTLQVSIDTLTQELNILEAAMTERTKAGYKMSLISPLELLLGSGNFETVLRKMKYIASIKEKDRQMLTEMSLSKDQLESEENKLIEDRAEVQELRNETEERRAQLESENTNLRSQTVQQQNLLLDSRHNEQTYTSQLKAVFAERNAITEAITEMITSTGGGAQYIGYVPAGTIIGLMGNSGLSSGAHLHFCISDSGNSFWGTIDPFSQLRMGPDYYRIGTNPAYDLGFVYWYVYSNKIICPVGTVGSNKPYLTQDWHQGSCVDISSQAGYSAPIYSVMAGDLTRGVDQYGGQWAQVVHPNGWTTTYLHLQ